MNELTPEQRQAIEQEIRNLQSDLFTMIDRSADYHCLKFLDNVLKSDKFWELFGDLELAYTRAELTEILNIRQAKRERIIELRKQLDDK